MTGIKNAAATGKVRQMNLEKLEKALERDSEAKKAIDAKSRIVAAARRLYADDSDDDIEIDDNATISIVNEAGGHSVRGCWVQAWAFVPEEEYKS